MPNLFALVLVALLQPPAFAQTYPEKPIRFIVGYAPGGVTDIVARALSQQLFARLGQQVVVDNRAGGSGTIAAVITAKAPPDGYTLLSHSFAFVINPAMYRQLPYDTDKDFIPITNYVNGLGYLLTFLLASMAIVSILDTQRNLLHLPPLRCPLTRQPQSRRPLHRHRYPRIRLRLPLRQPKRRHPNHPHLLLRPFISLI